MSLFHPRVIKKHINKMPPMDVSHSGILTAWAENLSKGIYDSETQNDGEFIQQILINVLGYVGSSEGESWSVAKNQPINQLNVDVALGKFSADSVKIIAPFELKGAKTKDLDAIMAGRGKTPVQQAWEYANEIHGGSCQWVIVSNYREIRLYAFGYGKKNYESFNLSQLNDPQEYKRFIMLLSAENLLSGKTLTFLKESEQVDKDITNQLYADYKSLRANLIKTLKQDNPDKNSLDIIKYTQTILDRVLFVAFAEDKGLLPDNTLKNAYETQNNFNPQPIWDNFKGLFHAIDKGNSTLKIPHYNGGLFAENAELDSLSISDALCEGFKKIGDYDFDSDVSVNILGHIFEQSISDLEELKAYADNTDAIDPKHSKRKKDGIFYTPAYITRYIVEQAVGGWLNDRREELGFDKLPEITDEEFELHNINIKSKNFTQKITQKFKTKRQQVARKVNKHIEFWEAYKESLSNIRVLDPACGSGAFLNEVFDYLKTAGEAVNSELAILKGEQTALFRWDTHILANNIYGVDLNNESVEITKLSLWLKTANRQEKLTYLENNIKCGNSLIDDKAVAGESAFNWNEEFPEIMDAGGFDVIVGNPPYVYLRNNNMGKKDKEYYRDKYKLYSLKPRTDVYFYESSFEHLQYNGYLSFIAPNNILTIGSLAEFRKYILEEFDCISFVNSKDKVFTDANVDTMISTMRKNNLNKKLNVWELEKTKFSHVGELDNIQFLSDNCVISYEMFSNPEKIILINKIEKKSQYLEDIAKISNGVVVYKVNNGIPLQTKEMAEKRVYHSFQKQGLDWLKYVQSDDLKRYNFTWSGEYVKYGENIGEKRTKVSFDKKRLLVRVIPSKAPNCINGMLLDNNLINDQNYIVVFECSLSEEAILAVLNSKLISFWFVNKLGKMQRGLFPQLKAGELKRFPIPKLNSKSENDLSEKVINIMASYKNLSLISENFTKLIQTEFGIEKLVSKLENWYELEFSDFVKEIEKSIKPRKLSLSQKAEWMTHFETEKAKAVALQSQIDQTDKEIDQMVYKLYDLTPEEIELIECSDAKI